MATLERCPRQYFFRYLAARDWRAPIGSPLRNLWHLRFLTTQPMLQGSIVHRSIREILIAAASDHPINPGWLIANAEGSFEATAKWAARHPLHQINPARPKLIESERGELVSDAEIAAARSSIADQLHAFLECPDVVELIAHIDRILLTFLDAEDFEVSRALGIPTSMKTDAVISEDSVYTIYDWKSGLPRESHRETALAYDLYVRRRLGLVTATSVKVRFLYLKTGEVREHVFNAEERADKLWQICEEFGDLERETLRAPRGEAAFPARVCRACRDCPFQFVCAPFKAANSGGALK